MKSVLVKLTDERSEALESFAEKLKCKSTSGKASWKIMLQQIADGFLIVKNPNEKRIFVDFLKSPSWWKPDGQHSMPTAIVCAKMKGTVKELVDKGFVENGDRLDASAWKAWRCKSVFDPKKRADWWKPDDENSMFTAVAMGASDLTIEKLTAGGLILSDNKYYLTCPDDWKGWVWRKSDVKSAAYSAPEPMPEEPDQPPSPEDVREIEDKKRIENDEFAAQLREMPSGNPGR